MRPSEPRSREPDEFVDRLALQAIISGNTQAAKAQQKIRAKIGFPEKGKGPDRIFSGGSLHLASWFRYEQETDFREGCFDCAVAFAPLRQPLRSA
jgi:hypothetical protein